MRRGVQRRPSTRSCPNCGAVQSLVSWNCEAIDRCEHRMEARTSMLCTFRFREYAHDVNGGINCPGEGLTPLYRQV